jgi:hypothetical protein
MTVGSPDAAASFTDPARIATFWESALGWRRTWEEEDQVCLEPPEGSPEDGIAPDLVFLKVPEGKRLAGCARIARYEARSALAAGLANIVGVGPCRKTRVALDLLVNGLSEHSGGTS